MKQIRTRSYRESCGLYTKEYGSLLLPWREVAYGLSEEVQELIRQKKQLQQQVEQYKQLNWNLNAWITRTLPIQV